MLIDMSFISKENKIVHIQYKVYKKLQVDSKVLFTNTYIFIYNYTLSDLIPSIFSLNQTNSKIILVLQRILA